MLWYRQVLNYLQNQLNLLLSFELQLLLLLFHLNYIEIYLNDKIYLIDWKSNKEIISDEDLNDNIQLSMYYWASRELGHEVDEIGLYFLRHLEYKTTTRTIWF